MLTGRLACAVGLAVLGAGLLIGCDQTPAQPPASPGAVSRVSAGAVTPTATAPAAEPTRLPEQGLVPVTPTPASPIVSGPATGSPVLVTNTAPSTAVELPPGRVLLAFQSFRNGQEGLYVMRDDGLDQVRLLDGADPAWSPEGRRLAFSQVRDNRDTLFVLDVSGSSEPARLSAGFSPSWSPDGRMLIFADTRQGNADIFVVNADGSGERALERSPANEVDPCWSLDGARVAFARSGQIVIGALDSAAQTVGDGKAYASHPAWSPDGRRIAFSWRNKDTNGDGLIDLQDDSQIAVMGVDGAHRAALTAFDPAVGKAVWAQHPAWSPDGSRLAFESNRDGKWDIYVMKADGSGLKNLTGEVRDSVNVSPSWRPAGR